MNHTPGEWKWWTSNSWLRLKSHQEGGRKVANVLEPFVARDGHPDLMVGSPDMALIASAPELLLELQALLTFAKDQGILEDDFGQGVENHVVDVIAKATGSTP